ncbi:MAG: hypothetical protein GXP31_04850 [Kiritimatiellaeota bacterium]|nr:hypothetical protein [Kiritimatiellota bacterium]
MPSAANQEPRIPPRRLRRLRCRRFILVLLFAGMPAGASVPEDRGAGGPQWLDSPYTALAESDIEQKPVLFYFTAPDSKACTRFRRDILDAEGLIPTLALFALAELDIEESADLARRFGVARPPAVVVLPAGGDTPVARLTPDMSVEEVRRALDAVLTPEARRSRRRQQVRTLLYRLQTGSLDDAGWVQLLLGMNDAGQRAAIRRQVFQLERFPAGPLTQLLEHPRLAVRCGAIELLEEQTGRNFGYDPWQKPGAVANRTALEQWRTWASSRAAGKQETPEKAIHAPSGAGKTGRRKVRYSPLTRDDAERLLAEYLRTEPERSIRAAHSLVQGGRAVAELLRRRLARPGGVQKADRDRVRQLMYVAFLNDAGAVQNGWRLARDLVFGARHARIAAIRTIGAAGPAAVPIMTDLLEDRQPLVREACVESLVQSLGLRAVAVLEAQLQKEKDPDVVFMALRKLGQVPTLRSLRLLVGRLRPTENEDLVLAALRSIGEIGAAAAPVAESVGKCLADPRWRVRAAVLETVRRIGLKSLADKVEKCLKDPDDFVRVRAFEAYIALASKEDLLKRLVPRALRDHRLIPLVAGGLDQRRAAPPKGLLEILPELKSEIALAVIEQCCENRQSMPVLAALVRHNDEDVVCAALRRMTLDAAKSREIVARQVRSGKRPRILAALESVAIPDSSANKSGFEVLAARARRLAKSAAPQSSSERNSASEQREDAALSQLLRAFAGASDETAVKTEAPAKVDRKSKNAARGRDVSPAAGTEADDLVSAFLGGGKESPGKTRKPANQAQGRSGSWKNLLQAVLDVFAATRDREVKAAAAAGVVALGQPDTLEWLAENWKGLTKRLRGRVSEKLSVVPAQCVNRRFFALMLDDPDPAVRERGAVLCVRRLGTPEIADLLFSRIASGRVVLTREMGYGAEGFRSADRTALRRWASKFLGMRSKVEMQAYGLCLFGLAWDKQKDGRRFDRFLVRTPYPRLQRFAALVLLACARGEERNKLIAEFCRHRSETVRKAVAAWLVPASNYWSSPLNAWSEMSAGRVPEGLFLLLERVQDAGGWNSRDAAPPKAVLKALGKLAVDSAPAVRVEAFFSSLAWRQAVDLAAFAEALAELPNQSETADRVARFMEQQKESLSPPFRLLLPWVRMSSRVSLVERMDLEKKLGAATRREGEDTVAHLRSPPTSDAADRGALGPASPDGGTAAGNARHAVYFYTPGCPDCRRVNGWLASLRRKIPGLEVHRYDIDAPDAMRLNEALCERFGVPERQRLTAPTVFTESGVMTRDRLQYPFLLALVAGSRGLPGLPPKWWAPPRESIEHAAARIEGRFQALDLGVVFLAGLSDGVNPCAFATLIFLISYLQLRGTRSRRTLLAGAGFVAGVFLAYFLVGLGLMGVLSVVSRLQAWSVFFQWGMAALVLVLAGLSLWDGVQCLRGRMGDMVLQLPGAFKTGAHAVIRRGMRAPHLVSAMFAVGVLVSLFELACTGQVYLPTIQYMVRQGGTRWAGAAWLALYNTAFVLPLATVFALAWSGVRHQAFAAWLQRHAAAVKFGTAVLFLLFFLLLVRQAAGGTVP